MRILCSLAITLLLSGTPLTRAQQNPIRSASVVEVEVSVRPKLPPKLPLRRASMLAQRQLAKRKISIRKYYLAEAKYTLLDIEGHLMPCWRLLWAGIADQPDLETYVFMDGNVQLPPNL